MKKIIIAIDGYSACGKSTTARQVAKEIGYSYIDTGAMYRATTLYFVNNYINITNPKAVQEALTKIDIEFRYNEKTDLNETYLNGLNVEKEIRKMYVSEKVSPVSTLSDVRKKMVEQQKKMGKAKGIVMDGRDIGTNVFPDAELKIFMQANIDVRAHRRQLELMDKDKTITIKDIIVNLEERDRIDTTRKENPLMKAEDAHVLDTSDLSFEAQVQYVLTLYKQTVEKLIEL